jgi:hypothetical protein
MRALAGQRADRYIAEFLLQPMERLLDEESLTIQDIRAAYSDAYDCLRTVYAHYAFLRRGKDRPELARIALEALDRTCDPDDFEDFLGEKDAQRLWENFVEVCVEKHRKPTEQLNMGVIAGLAELAQEIFRFDRVGSIAGWVLKGVLQTDHVEPQFLRIVDIRGVGPKIASFLIRDIVHIYGIENQVDRLDRIYIQPIDKWIRLIAPYVVPESGAKEMADWVLAGKLTKYARLAGISSIRFNMGATYFGIKEVRNPEALDEAIHELVA